MLAQQNDINFKNSKWKTLFSECTSIEPKKKKPIFIERQTINNFSIHIHANRNLNGKQLKESHAYALYFSNESKSSSLTEIFYLLFVCREKKRESIEFGVSSMGIWLAFCEQATVIYKTQTASRNQMWKRERERIQVEIALFALISSDGNDCILWIIFTKTRFYWISGLCVQFSFNFHNNHKSTHLKRAASWLHAKQSFKHRNWTKARKKHRLLDNRI